jgi:hypothetical protein
MLIVARIGFDPKCSCPVAPLQLVAAVKISPQRDFPLTAASATYFRQSE